MREMDAAAKEFLRLCDVAIAEAEHMLDRIQKGELNPALLEVATRTLENLWILRRKTEDGTLRRPSGGVGTPISRAVGEWADGTPLMDAALALDRFYRDHM
jgi:hypothetical protein